MNYETKLKTYHLDGKGYKYLEHKQGGKIYRTDYYARFKVTGKFVNSLDDISKGSTSGQVILQPIEDFHPEHMTVISILMERKLEVVIVYFEIGNKVVARKVVMMHKYLPYIIDLIDERKNILEDLTIGSMFNYMNDIRYKDDLMFYEQPQSPTRVGDTQFEYNKVYQLSNLNIKNEGLIETLNKEYDISKVKTIVVNTNDYGGVITLNLIDDKGNYISQFDEDYYKSQYKTIEEYIAKERVNEIHFIANKINKKIDNGAGKSIIHARNERVDKVWEEIVCNEPMVILISQGLLEDLDKEEFKIINV